MDNPAHTHFDRRLLLGAAGLAGVAALAASRSTAGPLNPPVGTVTSTGKTLSEVEPRTPINAANTPGDADSVYRITLPGSYYLTGNITLSAGDANKHAIEVAASGVTIDLCGFEVAGLGAAGGGFSAINVPSSASRGTRVLNGSVREWGGPGLNLKGQSHVSNVLVNSCARAAGQNAVRVWEGSVLESCTVNASAVSGQAIRCDERCVLRACTVSSAGTIGIACGNESTLEGCIVWQTGQSGYDAGEGTVLRGCVSGISAGIGFELRNGAVAIGCTSNDHGLEGFLLYPGAVAESCHAHSGAIGFSLGSNSVVRNCVVYANGQYGFLVPLNITRARITGCSATTCGVNFAVNGTACLLAGNTAGEPLTANWQVAPGNYCLVVAGSPVVVAINGNTGGVSPGSTNPHANFTL